METTVPFRDVDKLRPHITSAQTKCQPSVTRRRLLLPAQLPRPRVSPRHFTTVRLSTPGSRATSIQPPPLAPPLPPLRPTPPLSPRLRSRPRRARVFAPHHPASPRWGFPSPGPCPRRSTRPEILFPHPAFNPSSTARPARAPPHAAPGRVDTVARPVVASMIDRRSISPMRFATSPSPNPAGIWRLPATARESAPMHRVAGPSAGHPLPPVCVRGTGGRVARHLRDIVRKGSGFLATSGSLHAP